MKQARRPRGFTLVELMIVVAIVALLAAVALPRLGGVGRAARDTANWSRTITGTLEQLRTRAMSERKRFRASITSSTIQVQVWNTATSAWDNDGPAKTAPNEARVWEVAVAAATPSAIMSATHTIEFTPTFSIGVDGTSLNAYIYVGPLNVTGSNKTGQKYLINVIASGAVTRVDAW